VLNDNTGMTERKAYQVDIKFLGATIRVGPSGSDGTFRFTMHARNIQLCLSTVSFFFLLPRADRVLPKPITSHSKPPFGLLEVVSRLH
jgi:hypothetical protein